MSFPLAYLLPAAYLLVGGMLMLGTQTIVGRILTRTEIVRGVLLWPVFLLLAIEHFLLELIGRYRD